MKVFPRIEKKSKYTCRWKSLNRFVDINQKWNKNKFIDYFKNLR